MDQETLENELQAAQRQLDEKTDELVALKDALARCGYGILKAEKLYICDMSRAHHNEQQRTLQIVTRNIDLEHIVKLATQFVDTEYGDAAKAVYDKLEKAVTIFKKERGDRGPFGPVAENPDRNEIRILVDGPGCGQSSVAWLIRDQLALHGLKPFLMDPRGLVSQMSDHDHHERLNAVLTNETRVVVIVPGPHGSTS